MRRHHAPGDVLRICQRGDGTARVDGYGAATIVLRQIQDERLLAVQPRRFELRRDTINVTIDMHSPEDKPAHVDGGRHDGSSFAIDDRNRSLDVGFSESPVETDSYEVTLNFTPSVTDFIHMTYPERAIRKNETFPLRIRETVRREDKVPTKLVVDVAFTVREVTPDHVELTCKGTQVESARKNKQSAVAETDIACRVRIDRRDGRTARWWIDTTGKATLPNKPPLTFATHFDIAIGQVPDAADICARAADPSP